MADKEQEKYSKVYFEQGIEIQEIDARYLSEGLLQTTRLIDRHQHFVILLSHYNDVLGEGHAFDYTRLSELIGVEIELAEKKEAIFTNTKKFRHVHVYYGDIEQSISRIVEMMMQEFTWSEDYSKRYLAIQLLENPSSAVALPFVPSADLLTVVEQEKQRIEHTHHTSVMQQLTEHREAFVKGALQEVFVSAKKAILYSEKIDKVLTNKWLGFPILLFILYLMFEATFVLGAYPQAWVEAGIARLMDFLHETMPEKAFSYMIIDGLVAGVGAVLSFLPNIFILFILLAFLEHSGYMTRAAFLMDKIMHKVGLHGRSFIPLLLGFGCNVPAIMMAKDIENKKNRLLTMLMIPFMSCSARLPVYLFFVSAFFANYKALVMMSMYIIGVVLSILFALVMKQTKYFKQEKEDYVTSLPVMSIPSVKTLLHSACERSLDYLHKIVTVVLWSSILVWALTYFPTQEMDTSYLARFGQQAEWLVRPLGFNWQMFVCLLAGLPAKEAVVSTMAILFPSTTLQTACSPLVAFGFMVFVLLYFPCLETVMTLRKETTAGWTWFSVIHSIVLAWLMAFLIYQIGSCFVG